MIANPDFRTAKIMYCILFDGSGPVAQILAHKGRTVTGNFYINNCILEAEHHLTRRRPNTGAKDLDYCIIMLAHTKQSRSKRKSQVWEWLRWNINLIVQTWPRTTFIHSQSWRNTCLVDILIATQLSVGRYFLI